jgi:hypothetical protein
MTNASVGGHQDHPGLRHVLSSRQRVAAAPTPASRRRCSTCSSSPLCWYEHDGEPNTSCCSSSDWRCLSAHGLPVGLRQVSSPVGRAGASSSSRPFSKRDALRHQFLTEPSVCLIDDMVAKLSSSPMAIVGMVFFSADWVKISLVPSTSDGRHYQGAPLR